MPILVALYGKMGMLNSKQDIFYPLIWTLVIVTIALTAAQIKIEKREEAKSTKIQNAYRL
jgi:hypothetical protein